MERIFRKFQKTAILGQNGHFSAHLAKIDQNEKFYQKSGRAIFYPYCPPTSCQISEKSLERFPRSIRYIHPYIHTYKGETIEPVAFAGSIYTSNIFLKNNQTKFCSYTKITIIYKLLFIEKHKPTSTFAIIEKS